MTSSVLIIVSRLVCELLEVVVPNIIDNVHLVCKLGNITESKIPKYKC